MKISNAYPSKFVKAADLQDRPIVLAIDRVELEDVGDNDKKPVLYFLRTKKGLVLNKTNARMIAEIHGDDTDQWGGKQVELYPAMVQWKDEMVEAIRVRRPKTKAAVPTKLQPGMVPVAQHTDPEPPPAEPPDDMNDEIPF